MIQCVLRVGMIHFRLICILTLLICVLILYIKYFSFLYILFLAVLGLRCCMGCSLVVVRRLDIVVVSLAVENGP